MHDDQVDIDDTLVRTLIAEQFPQWAELSVEPVESAGTVNAIYRLGTEFGVRLPLTPGGVEDVVLEPRWRPRFGGPQGDRAAFGVIDTAAAIAEWEVALRAPEWSGPDCWVHADLSPGNLLLAEDRLSAVIDFGVMGVGEPAVDLITAWSRSLGLAAVRRRTPSHAQCDQCEEGVLHGMLRLSSTGCRPSAPPGSG